MPDRRYGLSPQQTPFEPSLQFCFSFRRTVYGCYQLCQIEFCTVFSGEVMGKVQDAEYTMFFGIAGVV